MQRKTDNQLDDGQPLVEFAPLKPAEFMTIPRPGAGAGGAQPEWRYVPVRRF